jgi:hypothetical protein
MNNFYFILFYFLGWDKSQRLNDILAGTVKKTSSMKSNFNVRKEHEIYILI